MSLSSFEIMAPNLYYFKINFVVFLWLKSREIYWLLSNWRQMSHASCYFISLHKFLTFGMYVCHCHISDITSFSILWRIGHCQDFLFNNARKMPTFHRGILTSTILKFKGELELSITCQPHQLWVVVETIELL